MNKDEKSKIRSEKPSASLDFMDRVSRGDSSYTDAMREIENAVGGGRSRKRFGVRRRSNIRRKR